MPRTVRLVLCDAGGAVLGALPPVDDASSWWPDVEPVVAAARDQFQAEVDVLRLLGADRPPAEDGATVTYLAELRAGTPDLLPAGIETPDEQPLRQPWAEPGGVRALVAWADTKLEALGRSRTEPTRQHRTWNLSAVLSLPTAEGPVWLKAAPPFFAHEGAAIALAATVAPDRVPPLLAHEPGRVLLGDVPGEDQWHPPEERRHAMARIWTGIQATLAGRVEAMTGLPDWRAARFPALAEELVRRPDVRATVAPDDLVAVDALVARLPARLAAIGDCGVPETLVHGDFHPGNWRSDGSSLVLIDWGDSGIGHPLLDLAAFLERVEPGLRAALRATVYDAWRAAVPGSDPEHAAALIEPVAALRQALIYRTFLDGIEPAERCYHEADVPQWLSTAGRAATRRAAGHASGRAAASSWG